MHVDQVLKAVRYGITEGSQFMWNCYGNAAWYLVCDNISAVIDRITGIVYELSIHIEDSDINYRWIHLEYLGKYIEECNTRNIDPWQAYDDVMYSHIEDENEMLKLVNSSYLYIVFKTD